MNAPGRAWQRPGDQPTRGRAIMSDEARFKDLAARVWIQEHVTVELCRRFLVGDEIEDFARYLEEKVTAAAKNDPEQAESLNRALCAFWFELAQKPVTGDRKF